MSGTSSLERRRAIRVSVVIPIEVRDPRGFCLHSSSDLSAGGVYFDRAIPHQVGTRVELSFNLPGDEHNVVCAGEVVNVPNVNAYGMGIQFIDMSPGDEAMLYEFIEGKP